MIRCNGIDTMKLLNPIIDRVEYPTFDALIDRIRDRFIKDHSKTEWGPGGKYCDGARFRSNPDILIRIVSACKSRHEFDEHRAQWVKAALDDCARADHWYEYEKRY